jgi:exodeoxyribonuclease-5
MWTAEQERALDATGRWIKDPGDKKIWRLFGYAGVGKTTLAKHLAEGVDGKVLFAAFTGKAASVLAAKGCPNASTIHSLIYKPKQASAERLRQLESDYVAYLKFLEEDRGIKSEDERKRNPRAIELKRLLEDERHNVSRPMFDLNVDSELRQASLLVVDECSMVDERMAEDLLWFGCPILVLGDPAQLPPVAGSGYFTDAEPDVLLTEVHRQAQESPILRLATEVRQGKNLGLHDMCDVPGLTILHKRELGERRDLMMDADQILVGRNKTRFSWNRRLRELHGITEPLPIVGDRLVCLRNNHDLGLLNGTIHMVRDQGVREAGQVTMTIEPEEGGRRVPVTAHECHFLGEKPHWTERKDAEEFDYGYAITVHKSQGSQWDNVTLMDESWCFRQDAQRWLYTGITRAAEKLTVILDD